MDQDNSNGLRPAEQITPQPALVPDENPDDYFTIKISKAKVGKFIKISLIIMFIISLWMNLIFLHAIPRQRHGIMNRIFTPRATQFRIYGGGGTYRIDNDLSKSIYSDGDIFYFNNEAEQDRPYPEFREYPEFPAYPDDPDFPEFPKKYSR